MSLSLYQVQRLWHLCGSFLSLGNQKTPSVHIWALLLGGSAVSTGVGLEISLTEDLALEGLFQWFGKATVHDSIQKQGLEPPRANL